MLGGAIIIKNSKIGKYDRIKIINKIRYITKIKIEI